jgi:hypothetical protein
MKLKDLKKEIPFKWRVQSYSKNKPVASCVAYIDARDVQDLLDKVVGAENWQCKYSEHKGNLFCSIGIDIGEESFKNEAPHENTAAKIIKSKWVWKEDCGTESQVEKQKGEASDAFKRAAVMWGIGRFLYSKKIQYVTANEKKTQSNYPHCIDGSGNKIWDVTEHINKQNGVINNLVAEPKKEPKKKGKLTEPIVAKLVEQEMTIELIKELYHVDEDQEKKLIKLLGDAKQ